jgi:dihydropteroate synthase
MHNPQNSPLDDVRKHALPSLGVSAPLAWTFSTRQYRTGRRTLLMGILNTTPDSFSDGGRWTILEAAVARGLELAAQGADILDVGGESTRPGAAPVSTEEELRRTIPIIERLRSRCELPISIDTYKAEVARQALGVGAEVVNDISGLTFDPEMLDVCARSDCGVICMHIQGTPQTMQRNPTYADVVAEVKSQLTSRLQVLSKSGIDRERIVLDPGIGFGKTAQHNLEILAHIHEFREIGRPVLIGHSRKSFLKKILNRSVDETGGTIGVAIAAAMQGADLLRVHDVGLVRDALDAWSAVAQQLP